MQTDAVSPASAAAKKRLHDRNQTRWMMGLRRHGGRALPLSIVAQLAAGLLLLPQAWLLARVIDDAVTHGLSRSALTVPIAIIAGLIAVRAALTFLAETMAVAGSENIMRQVRVGLFARLLGERPVWSAGRSSGAFCATIVDQVDALDGFFARFFPAMIQATFLPLAFAVAILPFDVTVALLFLFTAPLIPLFMALVGWGAEAAKNAEAKAFTRLSAHFSDRLRGILTLKLFGREEVEIAAVRNASEALRVRTMRVLRIAFLSSAVLEFFAALGVAGVALYVGLTFLGMLDLRGTMLTLHVGLFCLVMAPEVYQPLRQLAAHYHDRAGAKAAVAAIAAQFDALPQDAEPGFADPRTDRDTGAATLRFHGLTVRAPGGAAIIDGADFDMAAGDRIAVTGESGSGKTTLLDAVAGLRAADGDIELGGVAIADMDDAGLRRSVAYLGQKPRIFRGTVADNIRLADPSADDARMERAARRAQVCAFTDLLPLGLDTPVGDGGLGLSGGEAHRVALARIYLRDPAIILLDEPTAHLDAATEERVIDGLLDFARGRTLLVATHSAALAAHMDRSFRMAAGTFLPMPVRRTPAILDRKGAA